MGQSEQLPMLSGSGLGVHATGGGAMGKRLKAPFPYMGGKSSVARLVWSRLGDCANVIEPFCGSAAFLLARPHAPRIETVNDVSPYISNFWRATQREPEAVVEACDWPVNEMDLHARHRWLVLSPEAVAFRERMKADPEYFDAKIAGWWVWGACCWIGGEWCRYGDGPRETGPLEGPGRIKLGSGEGINAAGQEKRHRAHRGHGSGHGGSLPSVLGDPPNRRVKLSGGSPGSGALGTGVHRNAKPPHEWEATPSLRGQDGAAGNGIHASGGAGTCAERRAWLLDWFGRLRDRLRNVRVCCGHWLRVCDSESVTTRLGTTGIFLDPPYPIHQTPPGEGKKAKSRSGGLYQGDDAKVLLELRDEVLAYCRERGGDPMHRICVACYEGDGYEPLEKEGWDVVHWMSQGGYGNRNKDNANRKRERLIFSPHCQRQPSLLDALAPEVP